MIYYEKGRFRLGSVSFTLPDGIFISPEFEMDIENGFELVDPDDRFRVTILGENCDESSLTFLTQTLPVDSFHKVTEAEDISVNGIPGYKMAYYSECHNYLELRFDLSERDGINCLCIIMKCKKGVLSIEEMEKERMYLELVNSLALM